MCVEENSVLIFGDGGWGWIFEKCVCVCVCVCVYENGAINIWR